MGGYTKTHEVSCLRENRPLSTVNNYMPLENACSFQFLFADKHRVTSKKILIFLSVPARISNSSFKRNVKRYRMSLDSNGLE
jgi:hypothetical protein